MGVQRQILMEPNTRVHCGATGGQVDAWAGGSSGGQNMEGVLAIGDGALEQGTKPTHAPIRPCLRPYVHPPYDPARDKEIRPSRL